MAGSDPGPEIHFRGGVTSAKLSIRQSPRARVMRLRVDPRTAAVVLTLPRRVSQRRAMEWVAGQREWIETQLAQIIPAARIAPDTIVRLYDIPHRIDWTAGGSRIVRLDEGRLVVGGPIDNLEARILRWLRRHAADLLDRETREFAGKAGVSVSRTGVGDPVSRWGSCSTTGAIRYSWRLILAPDWVRRATVAHEVAHRVHMDHGPSFHALVEKLLGADPKPARSWLRSHGPSLHRLGGA